MSDSVNKKEILKTLITYLKVSQADFSKTTGVHKALVSEFYNGNKELSAPAIVKIKKTFKNINIHWLETGEGPMFDPNDKGEVYKGKYYTEEEMNETRAEVERLEKELAALKIKYFDDLMAKDSE